MQPRLSTSPVSASGRTLGTASELAGQELEPPATRRHSSSAASRCRPPAVELGVELYGREGEFDHGHREMRAILGRDTCSTSSTRL